MNKKKDFHAEHTAQHMKHTRSIYYLTPQGVIINAQV